MFELGLFTQAVGWDFACAQLLFDASVKSCLIPFSLPCLNSDFHPRLDEILCVQLLFHASFKGLVSFRLTNRVWTRAFHPRSGEILSVQLISDASLKGRVSFRSAYRVWTPTFTQGRVRFCVCSCFLIHPWRVLFNSGQPTVFELRFSPKVWCDFAWATAFWWLCPWK